MLLFKQCKVVWIIKHYKQCKQCNECIARCYLHFWCFFVEKKQSEKEVNILRRGIFLMSRRGKTEREKEESIWKREKEKEEEKKNGEVKGGKIMEKGQS